jgi:hypothetical protein
MGKRAWWDTRPGTTLAPPLMRRRALSATGQGVPVHLAAVTYRSFNHRQSVSSSLHHHADHVADRLNGPAQVQPADHDQSAFEALYALEAGNLNLEGTALVALCACDTSKGAGGSGFCWLPRTSARPRAQQKSREWVTSPPSRAE